MKFEENERIAFARILSDLIESDYVVEEGEMSSFFAMVEEGKELRASALMRSEAKRKTFAEATGILQRMEDPAKKTFVMDQLYRMSLSDGNCVPSEALQIMAVKKVLDGEGEVFSIPSEDNFIGDMKVIYIENEDQTEADSYINANYRAISNEFSLSGFEFVYIPRIVEDFRRIDNDYLRRVISFMMPLLDDLKIDRICQELCSMTTSMFTRKILFRKLNINVLGSTPSLLFKIGESYVADRSGMDDFERNVYSNYLLIPIDCVGESKKPDSNDFLDKVVELMDFYRSMVSDKISTETRQMSGKFIYSGFHRSLFDLIAYGKDKADYKLVINIYNRNTPVLLRPVGVDCDSAEDLPVDLFPQPSALYILMVCMSLLGDCRGLDWSHYDFNHPVKNFILEKFNKIYCEIGKGKKNVFEYRDRPQVSRIKSSIHCYEKLVTNAGLFIPEKIMADDREFYFVPVSPDLVYVVEDGREIRMVDSDFWRNI